METKVQPNHQQVTGADDCVFRSSLLPSFKELGPRRARLRGLRLARAAARSCSGFRSRWSWAPGVRRRRSARSFGVHSGLAMGSIYLDGSEGSRRKKWLPPMARWEKIGCFGLTEPLVGSRKPAAVLTHDGQGGKGDTWILNGQKRWIGNATWCDVSIILGGRRSCRQPGEGIHRRETSRRPVFSVEKIEHKIALKVVQKRPDHR